MRIATWNIERLKHNRELGEILKSCDDLNADILVLTETDERVRPDFRYCYQTPKLSEIQPDYYKPTENRVSIFTNYKLVRQHETFDKYTALCVELETERGNLIVYGTIIGVFGNRRKSFLTDLEQQIDDLKRLSALGNLCVAGDFNLSFADNYYFTKQGREKILRCFSENKIALLTRECSQGIDHIAVSEDFVGGSSVEISEWNLMKKLSDHKGVMVELIENFSKSDSE